MTDCSVWLYDSCCWQHNDLLLVVRNNTRAERRAIKGRTLLIHLNGHFGNHLSQLSQAIDAGATRITACLCRASSSETTKAFLPKAFDKWASHEDFQTKIKLIHKCNFVWKLSDRLLVGAVNRVPSLATFASQLLPRLSNYNSETNLSKATLLVSGYFQGRLPEKLSLSLLRGLMFGHYDGNTSNVGFTSLGDYAVVHIRRQDFEDSNFGVLPIAYYERALRRISTAIKGGPIKVFIVGDNSAPELERLICEDLSKWFELVDLSLTEIEGLEDNPRVVRDFRCMLSSRHLVVSNSTFSYWAALIGDVEDVSFPHPWYREHAQAQKARAEWTPIDSGF